MTDIKSSKKSIKTINSTKSKIKAQLYNDLHPEKSLKNTECFKRYKLSQFVSNWLNL
jgi:hypothetical protein